MPFKPKVFSLVKKIPRGKVTTYKELAEALDTSPHAIGGILPQNENIPQVPCHRVVKSNGELGGYKLGKEKKKDFLSKEGVKVVEGKINLDKYFYGFEDGE